MIRKRKSKLFLLIVLIITITFTLINIPKTRYKSISSLEAKMEEGSYSGKVYYVSNEKNKDGDGTINNPMTFEQMNKAEFSGGDRILLKKRREILWWDKY